MKYEIVLLMNEICKIPVYVITGTAGIAEAIIDLLICVSVYVLVLEFAV